MYTNMYTFLNTYLENVSVIYVLTLVITQLFNMENVLLFRCIALNTESQLCEC